MSQEQALAELLECDVKDVKDVTHEYDNVYSTDTGEYLVVDDTEADILWNESMDSYLDECILCRLPEIAQQYFDRESWKSDARMDGRGHSLSCYDGVEHYSDKYDLYLYRVN